MKIVIGHNKTYQKTALYNKETEQLISEHRIKDYMELKENLENIGYKCQVFLCQGFSPFPEKLSDCFKPERFSLECFVGV